jgi:hypothetical protein
MFHKYPSTENFQNFIKSYKSKKEFLGLGPDNSPIFKEIELGDIELSGTIKLHGTNAAITISSDKIFVQKRSDSMPLDMTKGDFHFGFMNFVHSNSKWFRNLYEQLTSDPTLNLTPESVLTIFGEWCGPGIQKGVAISQIPDKKFFIFGIQVQDDGRWLNLSQIPYKSHNERIWFITMFKTYTLRANLKDVAKLSQELSTITLEVENECPVAKEFGVSGIGEGLVWTGVDHLGNFIKFKTKGDKHQKVNGGNAQKIKVLKDANPNVNKFISEVDISNRLQQCYHSEFNNDVPNRSQTGKVLNWVFNDIISEEHHLLNELSLEVSDVKSALMESIRLLFFNDIEESIIKN